MARKRTPLTSSKDEKTSEQIANAAIEKIHGTSPNSIPTKKPGPVGFFSKWSEEDMSKIFVRTPKEIKKRLKITAVNQNKTEAQVIYEILNKYLDI